MTTLTQISLIVSVAFVAICALNTLDNIFGKNKKDNENK
jgi:hypothetical protein